MIIESFAYEIERELRMTNGSGNGAAYTNADEPTRELPSLDAGDRDLARITGAALKILTAANEPPFIFRHADSISRVQESDDGSLTVRPLNEDAMRGVLARVIRWYARTKEGVVYAELPPRHVAKDILVIPEPPFPVLTRVVRAPIFAPDGTLALKPGYSAAAKTYFDRGDFDVIPVPKEPLLEDVTFAREQISDMLADFPFVSDSERAHAVALLLQPFARELVDGPTPLFLIEKPAAGTGATLLADVLMYPFLGAPAAVMSEGRDEDEWRKRLLAKLVRDNRVILIDNIRRRLDSSALSSAITSKVWTERMLGQTNMINVPVKATWICTGNNPALSNEMARRTVRIRLDSKVDRPWLRGGFRHPNLREYVAAERAKLLWCALLLIQDWIAKGRPQGQQSLGMFENWARVMGGIVQNAGFQGFLSNLEELYEESDAEGEAWRQFVGAWWETYGSREVGVSELYKIINPTDTGAAADPLDINLGDGNEKSQKTRLGKLLAQNRDRQFDGKRLVKAGEKHRATRWKLEER